MHDVPADNDSATSSERRRALTSRDKEPLCGCLDPSRAFFCLMLDNPLRKAAIAVVNSKAFFIFVLCTIILNAVALAVPQPRYTDPQWLTDTLYYLEIAFTAVFGTEMVIKIVALGLAMHPGAYLRTPWNIFDGSVTVMSVVALSLDLQNISALRAFRILRALRTVSHVRQLRALLATLFKALAPVATSVVIIIWFMIFFAILLLHSCGDGVTSRRCYDTAPDGSHVLSDYGATHGCGAYFGCTTNQTCLINQTQFDASPLSYDNIGYASLTVLKLVAIDNWNLEMKRAVGTCGEHTIGVFLIVTLVGGFVMMNVFLAILMNEYTRAMNKQLKAEAEALARAAALTDISGIEQVATPGSVDIQVDVADDESEMTEVRPFHMLTPTAKIGNGPTPKAASAAKYKSSPDSKPLGRTVTFANSKAPAKSPKGASHHGPARSPKGMSLGGQSHLRGMSRSFFGQSTLVSAAEAAVADSDSEEESSSSSSDDLNIVATVVKEFDDWDSDEELDPQAATQHDLGDLGRLGSTTHLLRSESSANFLRTGSMANLNRTSSSATFHPRRASNDAAPLLGASATMRRASAQSQVSQHSGDPHLLSPTMVPVQPKRQGGTSPAGAAESLVVVEVSDEALNTTQRSAHSTQSSLHTAARGVSFRQTFPGQAEAEADATLREAAEEAEDPPSECRLRFRKVTDIFSNFMLFITLVNLVVLAIDHYKIDPDIKFVLDIISLVCAVLFAIELLMKIGAYGFFATFRDRFNVFDAVLVIASVVEFALANSTKISALRAIRILRLFRALKVLRLTRRATSLRIMLAALEPSVVPALFVLALLFIVVFVYAVLGMQFFGAENFQPFRVLFDTVWEAGISAFIIVTGEDWADILVTQMHGNGQHAAIAVVYFVTLFFIGNYIIVNLFGAVIVDHLERAAAAEWEEQLDAQVLALTTGTGAETQDLEPPRLFLPTVFDATNSMSGGVSPPTQAFTSDESEREAKMHFADESAPVQDSSLGFYRDKIAQGFGAVLQGHALFIFGPNNPIRRGCAVIVLSPAFAVLSVLVTCANVVFIALDSEYLDSGVFHDKDGIANYCFVGFYVFELLLQVVARGAVLPLDDTPKYDDGAHVGGMRERDDIVMYSFASTPGSVLIATIALHGVVGLALPIVRVCDSIRILRLALSLPRLRMLILSLLWTLPSVAQAAFLGLIFWTIFAIFGVQIFMGTYYACNDRTVEWESDCAGYFDPARLPYVYNATQYPFEARSPPFPNVSVVAAAGLTARAWERFDANFDSYPQAMFSLFVVAIGDRWTSVMYDGIDSTEPTRAPSRDSQPWMALFFIIFIFVGKFLTLNMIMGVLITFFIRLKNATDGTMLLSHDEREYLLTKRVLDSSMFEHDPGPPKNCVRRAVYLTVTTTPSQCKTACTSEKTKRKAKRNLLRGIGKHIVVLDFPIFEWVGSVITFLYAGSLALRGLGVVDREVLELVHYAMLGFLVVELLLKMIAYSAVDYFLISRNRVDFFVLCIAGLGFAAPVLRPYGKVVILLRTSRILSFLEYSENAQKLFALIIHSLPMLVTVVSALGIIFFIFAGVGVRLFAHATLDGVVLDELTNFRTTWHAMLTMYQVITSEGWFDVANQCAEPNEACAACTGNVSYPFFVFFVSFAFIVVLQLCAVVVVEHFEDLDACAERRLVGTFADLKVQWRTIARSTTASVSVEKLMRLLHKSPKRLTGLPVGATSRDLFKLIVKLRIPLSSDLKIHYRPLVHALVINAFRIDANTVRSYATRLHDELYDPRCFTAAHLLAVKVIAAKWRDCLDRRRGELSISSSGSLSE